MDYLADTNVVLRRVLRAQPGHEAVRAATDGLAGRGDELYCCPQNRIEFHAVATRPTDANGLGMAPADATQTARDIEAAFPMLPEAAAIYGHWRALVDRYGVVGRHAFDARLVAVMLAYGVTHLLTLNPTHFLRLPEITVVTPRDVAAGNAP